MCLVNIFGGFHNNPLKLLGDTPAFFVIHFVILMWMIVVVEWQ